MVDRYVYPALFRYHAGGVDVEFPDLPGAFTQGTDQADALQMAKECLGLHLFGMEEDNDPIPTPSLAANLVAGEDEAIVLIDVWMPPIRDAVQARAVKKTLTIPKWLNDLAEQHKVNFSYVLTQALKDYLGQKQH